MRKRYKHEIDLEEFECENFKNVEKFYDYLKKVKRLRPRTIWQYLYFLKKFDEFICSKNTKKITLETIYDFGRSFEWKDVGEQAQTRKMYFGFLVLKSYFEAVGKEEEFKEIEKKFKMGKNKYPKHKPVEFSMDEEQLQSLLTKVEDGQIKMLIKLIYYTGLRATEALLLKPEDVDFSSIPPTIKLNEEITKSFHPEMDEVYLPPKLAEELKNFITIRPRQYIFEFKPCGRIKNIEDIRREISFLDYHLKKYGTFVHLKNLSLHKLRHAFAHWLRNEGWRLEELQRLMRHSSIDVTSKYLQVSKEELKRKWLKLYTGFSD